MIDRYVILGVGKYIVNLEEILDAQYEAKADNSSYEILGFIDSDPEKQGKKFFGHKVLGTLEWLINYEEYINAVSFINPIGRSELVNVTQGHANIKFPNVIYPTAIISKKATIGYGNIFAQNTIVAPFVRINNFNLFNYAVSIGHHCRLGSFITCNGGVHIAGSSIVDDQVLIGPGAVIIDNVEIGEKSKIGANAVVRTDVPANVTAVGVPARIITSK